MLHYQSDITREVQMELDQQFIQQRREQLAWRLASKGRILSEGGEQALLHSDQDLVRIKYALKRIEDGQYGLCTRCGVPIDLERLTIIPETPFCVPCAQNIESHH